MEYKISTAIKIQYVSLSKVTGLTDLTLKTYNEANTLKSTTTLTEVGGGLYEGSFTPDSIGAWHVTITSATNGDNISKGYIIVEHILEDVYDLVDVIDGKVDLIKTETDKIQTIDDNVDLIKTETDKIQTIDDNVDLIKTETDKIQTIDDNVDAIKTKTDNLPADTAAVLQSIIDKLDAQENEGYIL